MNGKDKMSIEIRFYGNLRKKTSDLDDETGTIGITKLKENFEDISEVLKKFKINEEEVSHIFLNGEYSDPSRKIEQGDRLALFSKDMALLYKWYFKPKK